MSFGMMLRRERQFGAGVALRWMAMAWKWSRLAARAARDGNWRQAGRAYAVALDAYDEAHWEFRR